MARLLVAVMVMMMMHLVSGNPVPTHNYADALSKSILFFEGQRSGKLPPWQRMRWRKDSGLHDGFDVGMDLVGGYYDAGDNVKFNFPMAFSTTMLAWSVIEFGKFMGPDLKNALEAVRWGTDYLLKCTSVPGVVFVQVGDPYADHNCWQRPEDMDTPRTSYAVDTAHPGSEVSAEIAAAFAASSIVFRIADPVYSVKLLKRATMVFAFADTYRGSYNDSLGHWVCPFYCDFSGFQDELLWAAGWLHRATGLPLYWKYLVENVHNLESISPTYGGGSFAEFGWDSKHAGINILVSKRLLFGRFNGIDPFHTNADRFVCSIVPDSPTRSVEYSPGGLLFKPGGSNMQHPTALSFLLLVYARYLSHVHKVVQCDDVVVTPSRLIQLAKDQVDYILGSNPLQMSYMVGYGTKFPQKIHHRGSTLPSMDQHPEHIECGGGTPYFQSKNPNPNVLVGAVVGGPYINDSYPDTRELFVQTEPTTYINAPLVGVLAYFNGHPLQKM